MRIYISRLKKLLNGQSLARILMNESLVLQTLQGVVVDVGGGRNPDYFDYLKQEDGTQIEMIDGSISNIDFEKDRLPFVDAYTDTVLLCNVLEHIYNYQFLVKQIHRVLKKNGQLIGFVPFWVGYHPDPHDYFRYTPESLRRIFSDTGFKNVKIVPIGGGPILANFNTIVLSMPSILRPVVYVWYSTLDALFLCLRPKSKARNPLGFIFTAMKK